MRTIACELGCSPSTISYKVKLFCFIIASKK
ncbi:helix-turn-helix domain-containing protein [Lactobacillus agrestimuris]